MNALIFRIVDSCFALLLWLLAAKLLLLAVVNPGTVQLLAMMWWR